MQTSSNSWPATKNARKPLARLWAVVTSSTRRITVDDWVGIAVLLLATAAALWSS